MLNRHRLNYIYWLQDLLDTTSGKGDDQYDPDRQVVGLDMYVYLVVYQYNTDYVATAGLDVVLFILS